MDAVGVRVSDRWGCVLMAETMDQFLSDPPPAFVLAENKNHDTLVDIATTFTTLVPTFARMNDAPQTANLLLCILEQAYWRGYQDSKQTVTFQVGDAS